jgi:hypothetical protein
LRSTASSHRSSSNSGLNVPPSTNPILEFHTHTTRHANLKEHTLAVFLDIERAFDRVWHDGLVQKLIKIPINPNFIQLIDSFLSNRTCSVKIQNIKSRPITLQTGVPQGSILFPLLYIVYCRDFPVTDAPRMKTRLFADDIAVWTSQRNPVIAARVHLNDITTWTNTWRIKPNRNQQFQAPHLRLNNQSIPKLILPKIAPSTRTSMKPSKNPATEPTSCIGFEGTSEGATRKPCTTPTKPSSVPSSNTAPPSTPPYTLPSSTKSPPAREECSAGSFDSPTGSPPSTSTRKLTQSRSNPASKKYPSRDGRLLNRIPKIPKRKLKHPPTALLSPAYTDLPDDLQELVDSTPLTMRWPSTTPGLPGLRTSNPVSPSNPPPPFFSCSSFSISIT